MRTFSNDEKMIMALGTSIISAVENQEITDLNHVRKLLKNVAVAYFNWLEAKKIKSKTVNSLSDELMKLIIDNCIEFAERSIKGKNNEH